MALCLILLALLGCTDDEKRIEGKWQLKYYELPTNEIQKVDSVFYNFQKGTFSAICISKDGTYDTFFGRYTLNSDKISINLLDGYAGNVYEKYLNWPDGLRVYAIDELTSSVLHLSFKDTLSVFRKY